MNRWSVRRVLVLFAITVTVAAVTLPHARAERGRPDCGPGDVPETGMSGEVPLAEQLSGTVARDYRCRIRPVAISDLGGRGVDTQMTWSGDCAYVVVPGGESDGVAVVDMSIPAAPKVVKVLREKAWAGRGGQLSIHEGVDADTERGVLVVPIGYLLTIYDISSDCRQPQLVSKLNFGAPPDPLKPEGFSWGVHSGQLSPDGTLYYATDLGMPGMSSPRGPCITVIDLADLAHPTLLTRWGTEFPCHDLDFNDDGTVAFLGYYGETIGQPAATVGAFTPPAAIVQQQLNGLRIVDVSDIQAHRPNPKPKIIGQLTGGRNHTEVFTRIGGRPYVIGAEEGYCPGGTARIVDVSNPRHPVEVSEISLEVNELPCTAGGPIGFGPMTHYLSVDDTADANLVFITWYTAGLRVFDISNPKKPVEVAYYNPGNSTTDPRYLSETGQIWFGGGNTFNVVELDPALRPQANAAARGWSTSVATRELQRAAAPAQIAPVPLLHPLPLVR